jgi:proteic killer suppression protein
MQISYKNERLKHEFNNERELKRTRGQLADKIKIRQTQMEAATSLEQLRNQPGHFHELTGNLAGQLACSISGNYRLIFTVANNPVPKSATGGLDWSKVTHVCIQGVLDYHG